MINVGELDLRLTLWSVSTSRNAKTNQEVKSYSVLTTVWAKQLAVTNRGADLNRGGEKSDEQYEAQQLVAVSKVRFFMRWSSTVASVTEKMMMSLGSTVYEISGKEDFGRRQGFIILPGEVRDNLTVTADSTITTLDSEVTMDSM